MPTIYQLTIEDDAGRSTVIPLPPARAEITIGRKEGNTIRLIEQNISRLHARLVRAEEAYFIEDRESYNGIKVNGERINGRCYLKDGDLVILGDYRLSLRLEKPTSQAVAPATPALPAPVAEKPAAPAKIEEKKEPSPRSLPRLCVLSGPLAGKIFLLQQSEILIGRIEENDIVLNHPSISRNHAKIIIEENTCKIVDLGSANGVRVNNEEYHQVALASGDKVDLGLVRLRFITPGEEFVFTPSMREEPSVDEPEELEDSNNNSLGRWFKSLRPKK